MLFTTQEYNEIPIILTDDPLIINLVNKRTWYKYSMTIENIEYFVNIGHRNRGFSAEDLMGFNNTGNICIWPSEETLAYYVGANLNIFRNKTILELGGGMSCLAGFISAKYGQGKHVTLTDGNKISIENVLTSYYCNEFSCPVLYDVLRWGHIESDIKYDIILCADCLFFDDARHDLIESLWCLLDDKGIGLIMAPRRGNTLTSFLKQSRIKGFKCDEIITYNKNVWDKHLSLLNNVEYDENIHYPILIKLTKY